MIDDLGFYKVNDKVFYNKNDAMLYASQVGGNLTWSYHRDKFDAVDWTVEPILSLDELYRIRAQQIRDKYDYVALFLSGGADSTNMAWAFVNNNIRIDEIIISEPTSGMRNFKTSTDTSIGNHISEIKYAALPLANKIKAKCPNVVITMNDVFQNMLDFKDEEWAFKSCDWIHPSSMGRFAINRLTHIRKLAEAGKSIGLVYGVDKPVVICDSDNNLKAVLVDYGVNVPQQPFDIIYPSIDRVLFYWTPDLPEMLVKQCHTVAKEIYKPENAHVLALMHDQRKPPLHDLADRERHNRYERLIMHWIYPAIDCNVFQADKFRHLIRGEHDEWLYTLHKDERVTQKIISDATLLTRSVDRRFMTDSGHAFKRHLYKWIIGPEWKFKGTSTFVT